ncbi:MAG: hypothetical protein JWO78_1191 [Micavibrio sp.]|nr:hypothetical protein [Micavibrio sp.]
MALSPDTLKVIDCANGNPLFPLTSAANYAFKESRKDLHRYQFLAAGYSEYSVRRTLDRLSDHFTSRGIQPRGWTGLPFTDMMPVGGGTTGAFHLILNRLAEDVAAENKRCNRNIRPAILMPVPTYGFFIDTAEALGFDIVKVQRNLTEGGRLEWNDVRTAIRGAVHQDRRLVAFFDSNPNNPTGLVRTEGETRKLGKLFQGLNDLYEQEENKVLREWQKTQEFISFGTGENAFKTKPGRAWDGLSSRINIIEDMVYDGLEYSSEKPFAFAQIDELYKHCFTLFGISKAGLANLRGAVIVADSQKLHDLNHDRLLSEYFISKPALHAMEAYFNVTEPFLSQRRRHLDRMNDAHRFRGLLMKALINGMDTMAELDDADRQRLVQTIARSGKGKAEALRLLTAGIPGLRVLTTPQAGFFHLIDFSDLKGREYSNTFVHYKRYSGMTVAEDSEAIRHVFGAGQRLSFASGSWMGLDEKAGVARATFAMPVADIIEVTERLRAGMSDFRKQAPKSVPNNAVALSR